MECCCSIRNVQDNVLMWNSHQQIQTKRGGHSKKETINSECPCRTDEILQEGQPLFTAVYKAEGVLKREYQQHSSEEAWDQDSDPDVEARQDFWSVMGDYIYWNHVAPRSKLCVPKDDFPLPLNCMDVHRQTKTSLDELQEATIDDHWNMDGDTSLSEPWIGVTRFALLNKNTPERFSWFQVDEETGHNKIGTTWPEELSNMSKGSQRKAVKQMS